MAGAVSLVGRLGQAALELVFPSRCLACGGGGAFLCDACAGSLVPAAPPRCARCWRPGADAAACLDCRLAPPAFDALRAAFRYEGVARLLVQGLKYRGLTVLAAPMASLLAAAARTYGLGAHVVVPVPLSGRRGRTRGYNQAELLGRALARELALPFEPRALRRLRHTPPQARSHDAKERRSNVAGAFAAGRPNLAGRSILLVDDVTTTGATLAACAAALKAAGARSVWGLAFARED